MPVCISSRISRIPFSRHQRSMIAEINTAYTPALVVLDGVEAFVSGGPSKGKRVWTAAVLASSDRVAIDAVGVALLRRFGTTRKVSRGSIFGEQGKHSQAIADCSRAVQLEPTRAAAYFHRGIAYMDHDQWDRAIADFNEEMKELREHNNYFPLEGEDETAENITLLENGGGGEADIVLVEAVLSKTEARVNEIVWVR